MNVLRQEYQGRCCLIQLQTCQRCISLLFCTDLTFTVGCNHLRSTEFYIKTLTEDCPKPFKGYPCSSYVWYKIGWCNDCGKEGCPLMGFRAEETHPEGEFYLETSPMDTLCRELIVNCTRFSRRNVFHTFIALYVVSNGSHYYHRHQSCDERSFCPKIKMAATLAQIY